MSICHLCSLSLLYSVKKESWGKPYCISWESLGPRLWSSEHSLKANQARLPVEHSLSSVCLIWFILATQLFIHKSALNVFWIHAAVTTCHRCRVNVQVMCSDYTEFVIGYNLSHLSVFWLHTACHTCPLNVFRLLIACPNNCSCENSIQFNSIYFHIIIKNIQRITMHGNIIAPNINQDYNIIKNSRIRTDIKW